MGEGWHTFRCEVRGGTGTYFYDKKQVGSLSVVQKPQYIILGNQSGLCLDVTGQNTANGTLAEIWTCNGGANQKWVR